MSTFEDNLWRDLVRDHHAEHAHPGRVTAGTLVRRRRLAGSSLGLAAAGTAAALALTAGTAAPAFAVTSNPNGTVTVTINEIAGISGANAELAALGVRARAVPIVQGCAAPLLSPQGTPEGSPPPAIDSVPQSGLPHSITFEPSVPAGDTLVLAAKQSAAGPATGVQLFDGIVQGAAPACLAQATAGKHSDHRRWISDHRLTCSRDHTSIDVLPHDREDVASPLASRRARLSLHRALHNPRRPQRSPEAPPVVAARRASRQHGRQNGLRALL